MTVCSGASTNTTTTTTTTTTRNNTKTKTKRINEKRIHKTNRSSTKLVNHASFTFHAIGIYLKGVKRDTTNEEHNTIRYSSNTSSIYSGHSWSIPLKDLNLPLTIDETEEVDEDYYDSGWSSSSSPASSTVISVAFESHNGDRKWECRHRIENTNTRQGEEELEALRQFVRGVEKQAGKCIAKREKKKRKRIEQEAEMQAERDDYYHDSNRPMFRRRGRQFQSTRGARRSFEVGGGGRLGGNKSIVQRDVPYHRGIPYFTGRSTTSAGLSFKGGKKKKQQRPVDYAFSSSDEDDEIEEKEKKKHEEERDSAPPAAEQNEEGNEDNGHCHCQEARATEETLFRDKNDKQTVDDTEDNDDDAPIPSKKKIRRRHILDDDDDEDEGNNDLAVPLDNEYKECHHHNREGEKHGSGADKKDIDSSVIPSTTATRSNDNAEISGAEVTEDERDDENGDDSNGDEHDKNDVAKKKTGAAITSFFKPLRGGGGTSSSSKSNASKSMSSSMSSARDSAPDKRDGNEDNDSDVEEESRDAKGTTVYTGQGLDGNANVKGSSLITGGEGVEESKKKSDFRTMPDAAAAPALHLPPDADTTTTANCSETQKEHDRSEMDHREEQEEQRTGDHDDNGDDKNTVKNENECLPPPLLVDNGIIGEEERSVTSSTTNRFSPTPVRKRKNRFKSYGRLAMKKQIAEKHWTETILAPSNSRLLPELEETGNNLEWTEYNDRIRDISSNIDGHNTCLSTSPKSAPMTHGTLPAPPSFSTPSPSSPLLPRLNPSRDATPRKSDTSFLPSGLRNLGSTCYMNASLQMLYSLSGFLRGALDFEKSIMQKQQHRSQCGQKSPYSSLSLSTTTTGKTAITPVPPRPPTALNDFSSVSPSSPHFSSLGGGADNSVDWNNADFPLHSSLLCVFDLLSAKMNKDENDKSCWGHDNFGCLSSSSSNAVKRVLKVICDLVPHYQGGNGSRGSSIASFSQHTDHYSRPQQQHRRPEQQQQDAHEFVLDLLEQLNLEEERFLSHMKHQRAGKEERENDCGECATKETAATGLTIATPARLITPMKGKETSTSTMLPTAGEDFVASLRSPLTPTPTDSHFKLSVEVRLVCDECGYSRSKVETYRHLSLDLIIPPVPNQNIQTERDRDGELRRRQQQQFTIEDGIRNFFSPETIQISCEKCSIGRTCTQSMHLMGASSGSNDGSSCSDGEKEGSSLCPSLSASTASQQPPKALLLHLKRFTVVHDVVGASSTGMSTSAYYVKNRERVSFPSTLRLDSFSSSPSVKRQVRGCGTTNKIDNEGTPPLYRLKSVVHHIGSTPHRGHYTTDALRRRPRPRSHRVDNEDCQSFVKGGELMTMAANRGEQKGEEKRKQEQVVDEKEEELWFRFDDGLVKPISTHEAIHGEEAERNAYMILYELADFA